MKQKYLIYSLIFFVIGIASYSFLVSYANSKNVYGVYNNVPTGFIFIIFIFNFISFICALLSGKKEGSSSLVIMFLVLGNLFWIFLLFAGFMIGSGMSSG